jgi:hypothetical protein
MNTVKQQHTSTATSILTTKSTYRSLSAQRLSERTVKDCLFRTARACVWFFLNVGNSLSNRTKSHVIKLRTSYS